MSKQLLVINEDNGLKKSRKKSTQRRSVLTIEFFEHLSFSSFQRSISTFTPSHQETIPGSIRFEFYCSLLVNQKSCILQVGMGKFFISIRNWLIIVGSLYIKHFNLTLVSLVRRTDQLVSTLFYDLCLTRCWNSLGKGHHKALKNL